MSCELGIAPQYLIDLDTQMFKMMLKVMEERAKGSQMAATVKGAITLRKALKNYAPDLAKQMPKEIGLSLKPVVKAAKGYLPDNGSILSNWRNRENATGNFPLYDSKTARAGITYKTTPSKPNRRGFRSLARLMNKSAAGAIYETAGRKKSDSTFVLNLESKVSSSMKGDGKMSGRALFRAWEEDHGKAHDGVLRAIAKADKEFKART